MVFPPLRYGNAFLMRGIWGIYGVPPIGGTTILTGEFQSSNIQSNIYIILV